MGARLRKAEVLPRKTLADGMIHVQVAPLASGDPGYRFDVYAERNDQKLPGTTVSQECVACSEDALVEQIAAAVDGCLPPLAASATSSVRKPVVEESMANQPEPEPHFDDRSKPARLGVKGRTGIGLLVAGGAAAIAGAIFTVQGRAFDTRPGELEQEGLDFRPPGIGLLAGGGGALIAGAVLLGIDVRQRRRTRASVSAGPGWTGVTWGGRF